MKRMRMIIFNSFRMTACATIVVMAVSQVSNYAVSSLVGSEEFYFRMKRFVSDPPEEYYDYESFKIHCCEAIIRSPLFNILHNMDPVDLYDEDIQSNLKQNHPNIYQNLFKTSNSSKNDNTIELTNPYKMRDVILNEVLVREYVFSCLGRNRKSRNIVEYFISRAYDVNEYPSRSTILGRFVFSQNEKKDLNVAALAEQPARREPSKQASVENRYLERHEHVLYDEYDMNDTICGLSTFQKIRLCSIILSAEEYQRKVMFLPDKNNIDPPCKHKNIRFEFHALGPRDTLQYDWMMGCKAVKVGSNEPVTYYVSKGLQANDFFICKALEDEGAVLDNLSCEISVVPTIYVHKRYKHNW